MRKAFTLIEMLIVVVVLVTLMTITFKLGSIGGESEARARTITRMQSIENCLSGYMAAFGSYPPVKVHGSRNIYMKADKNGIQSEDEENTSIWGWTTIGSAAEYQAWYQVQAACRSQPVDCQYPFCEGYADYVKAISKEIQRRANSGSSQYKDYWEDAETKTKLSTPFDDLVNGGHLGQVTGSDESDWSRKQLFKFGLMSYLLPRYQLMMNYDSSYRDVLFKDPQWTGNNSTPSNPFTGESNTLLSWSDISGYVNGTDKVKKMLVRMITSQSVCERWMPNLAKVCACNGTAQGIITSVYKIDIKGTMSDDNLLTISPSVKTYSTGGSYQASGDQYVLDGVSIKDGWGEELYYYSPAPYQTYTLWSSGANKRTFPPWIDRKNDTTLSGDANKCIGLWIEDDITHLSN